jgi:hypothetical protein
LVNRAYILPYDVVNDELIAFSCVLRYVSNDHVYDIAAPVVVSPVDAWVANPRNNKAQIIEIPAIFGKFFISLFI